MQRNGGRSGGAGAGLPLLLGALLDVYAIARLVGARFTAAVDGFAAGALLVMLVGSMIPEAKQKAAIGAGFAAVIGYAVAAGLSAIS
ncbi:MAG TPA: hypothetical protein VNC63_11020 [Propionibacteriaceae bacterium]|nr:hypothetical protein [Propionibacteriaceae bacterium]